MIIDGFENSEYYCSSLSLDILFKELIDMHLQIDTTMKDQMQDLILNTLTGGIKMKTTKKQKTDETEQGMIDEQEQIDEMDETPELVEIEEKPRRRKRASKNKDSQKQITFGTDLKIIMNNIVGIIGYEFTYCLLFLSSLPIVIKKKIKSVYDIFCFIAFITFVVFKMRVCLNCLKHRITPLVLIITKIR